MGQGRRGTDEGRETGEEKVRREVWNIVEMRKIERLEKINGCLND